MTTEDKKVFRHFIGINWREAAKQLSTDDIDALGYEFNNYLFNIVKITDNVKTNIMPKSMVDVFSKHLNPLFDKGFHPAYVLHFNDFINHMKNNQSN